MYTLEEWISKIDAQLEYFNSCNPELVQREKEVFMEIKARLLRAKDSIKLECYYCKTTHQLYPDERKGYICARCS